MKEKALYANFEVLSRTSKKSSGLGSPTAGDPVGREEHLQLTLWRERSTLQVGICKEKYCNHDSKARWSIKVVGKG